MIRQESVSLRFVLLISTGNAMPYRTLIEYGDLLHAFCAASKTLLRVFG